MGGRLNVISFSNVNPFSRPAQPKLDKNLNAEALLPRGFWAETQRFLKWLILHRKSISTESFHIEERKETKGLNGLPVSFSFYVLRFRLRLATETVSRWGKVEFCIKRNNRRVLSGAGQVF